MRNPACSLILPSRDRKGAGPCRTTLLALALCLPALAQAPLKLTLKQAETIAVQQNPRLGSARFTAEAASQVPKEIASVYQPTAFGSITGVGASDGSRLAAGQLNNPIIYNRFASGIGVSQLITDFGRTHHLVAASKQRANAEQENANATRADILLAVDRAYFALLRSQAVLHVAEQTVSARQLVADQIHALAANALKSNLDVSFAEVNLQEAKLMLASAQNDVKASAAQLANALGYPNVAEFALSDEPMPDAPPDKMDGLLGEAINNRPELAGARFEQQAAESTVKAERALSYPSIAAGASIGLVPVGVSELQTKYGAAGLNVNIPIFNGGLFTARRSEAEFHERASSEDVKDLQNRIVRDVKTAYLNAVTGCERLNLTQKLLDQAQMGFNLAQSRYNLGLGSIVELSQAQLNLTSAQIANTTARYDYQAQFSMLQYQIGALR
jgi:outer membrane protein